MQWELMIQEHLHKSTGRRIQVEADSWFAALQAGLRRTTGQQTSVSGVTCSVRPDGGVDVRDFISRREYVLIPLPENAAQDEERSVDHSVPETLSSLPAESEPSRYDSASVLPVEDMLVRAFEQMQGMYSLRDHDDVARFVLSVVGDLLPSEGGAFMLMRPGHNEMYVACSSGSEAVFVPEQSMSISKGMIGFCIRNSAVLHIDLPATDARFNSATDWPFDYALRNLVCIPVQHEGRTHGVLELYNSAQSESFSLSDINACVYIAGVAAEFIERSLPHRDPPPRKAPSVVLQEQASRARSGSSRSV